MSIKTSLVFLSLIPKKKPEWTKKSDDECQKTNKKFRIKKGKQKAFFHSLCVHFFPSVVFTKNILLFASSSSSNDKHIVKKRERIGSNANTKYNVLVFVVFFSSRVFLRQYAAENEVARLLLRFFVFFFFCAFEFVVFVGRRRKEEEKVCPPPGVDEECRQKHEREDDDEAKKQR